MEHRLNYSGEGHQINAEQITVPRTAPYVVRLEHHYIKQSIPSVVEIWQNSNKTGNTLSEEPYSGTVSGKGRFQVDYDGQKDGDVKYCNALLFHSSQANTTWYVWYKSRGDVVDAETINNLLDYAYLTDTVNNITYRFSVSGDRISYEEVS
jgi:hypothetical protein